MKRRQAIGIVVFVLLTAACSGTRAPRPAPAGAQAPPGGAGAGLTDAGDRARVEALLAERSREPDTGGYRIGPDDLLEIRIPDLLDTAAGGVTPRTADGGIAPVAGAPVFAQGVRVSASGDVTVPLLGQVRAAGLAPTELERDIAHRLVERNILRAPQVSVTVVEYRSGVVAVVGAVEHPGVFPATRPGATVGDLIWAAGGPTKDAGRVVQFTPAHASASGHDGRPEPSANPIRLDLESLLNAPGDGHGAAAIRVRPGDVISLRPAGNVTVEGWVEKPGSYPITRGLTVSGAVAAAGGPNFAADRRHAQVQRVVGTSDQQLLTVDLQDIASGRAPDLVMTDGDVVRLSASNARLVPWSMWKVVSTMVRVGGNVLLF
jgi:polysaccharide export outer membrane protein